MRARPVSPSPASLLQRFLAPFVRLVLVIGGMVLMAGALLLGIVVAAGVVLWALLRGRRPGPVNLLWRTMPPAPPGAARGHAGEVIDVQAREIESPPPR